MYDIILQTPDRQGLPARLPVWANPVFLQAVAELQQAEARLLVLRKGEQVVALMPLFEKKQLGMRRLFCPMSAYYQGLWFFWQEGREAGRNLLDELKASSEAASYLRSRYKRAQFNLAPHNLDVRGFTWAGYQARPFYTFTQELSEPMSMLKDERKKIKMAGEQGYSLDERFLPEVFIGMFKDLYHRKNKELGLSYGRFQKWMERLHGEGLLAQFNLLRDEKVVSTNLLLGGPDDDTGYSILRSSLPDEMKHGASALHSVLLVERLADRFARLDFCGGNTPEVARFKAALGFRLRQFFKIVG